MAKSGPISCKSAQKSRGGAPADKVAIAVTVNISLELGRVLGRLSPHPCAQSFVANIMNNGNVHLDGIGEIQIQIAA